jgi:predicted amidohydrolase YtcJ
MTTQSHADVVLLSDHVLTMADAPGGDAGCVAIAGGRILATAPRSEAQRFIGPDTQVIDVGARPVLPGFIDVHAHYEVAARVLYETIDCRAPQCSSIDDVLSKLSDNLGEARDGWLVGQANLFFDQKLAERRLPTREELDTVSTDVAIALRAGGHITVLNTRGLERAGIDRDFRSPEHSVTGIPIVERDEHGDPTGVVREMDNLLPVPRVEGDELATALRDGARELFTANGVTTVGEISETLDGIRRMDELHRSGDLGLRVDVYLWAPGTVSVDDACNWRAVLPLSAGDDLLRVKGLKLFADGGYSAASAAVKRPYTMHPHSCGTVALAAEDVTSAFHRTQEAGLQLAVHANGDRAQEEVCAAIEAAGGSPAGPLRTRIEHAGNFLPEPEVTIDAWRRAGIVPVPQPIFLYTFGDFFPTYLGDYGAQGRFPFRSLIADGWRISGSSDVWIGSEAGATNPMLSIWSSVKRQTFNGAVIDPQEAIDVEEALRMHTIYAAEVLGEEAAKGSLEPGKLADVIVLDRDPRAVDPDGLLDVKVDLVFLGGRCVHDRSAEGSAPALSAKGGGAPA